MFQTIILVKIKEKITGNEPDDAIELFSDVNKPVGQQKKNKGFTGNR